MFEIARDQTVDATSGVSLIPLLIVPGRCDAHAIIEDKRGTVMPLDVQTNDGSSGTIYIAMADNVRRNIYEYYQDYCDFGSDPSKRAGVATLVVASSDRTPLGVTREGASFEPTVRGQTHTGLR